MRTHLLPNNQRPLTQRLGFSVPATFAEQHRKVIQRCSNLQLQQQRMTTHTLSLQTHCTVQHSQTHDTN